MKIEPYKPIETKEGVFNISPSSLHSWFDNPMMWYKNQVLKESTFRGSTNTVFGSIIHGVAEAHYKGLEVSLNDVEEYVQKYQDNQEVDLWYIYSNFIEAKELMIDFLDSRKKPTSVEQQVVFEPIEGYSIGGTYDALTDDKLTDYKTCTTFSSVIKPQHKFQMLCYVLAIEATSTTRIKYIEVVQFKKGDADGTISEKTGKRIGIKKPEIKPIVEEITQQDRDDCKKHLKQIIKCLKLSRENPDLIDVLFRENPTSYIKD